MNKQVRKNKRLKWRDTYGKVFIRRRSLKLVHMAQAAAIGVAGLSAITSSMNGCLLDRKVAAALCVADTAKAVSSLSKDLNDGFLNLRQGENE